MLNKSYPILIYFLIALALGAGSVSLLPLVQVVKSTDSSSACWNMDGIIDPKTGACILPECPAGTVRESSILTGTKCNPISTPRSDAEQLGSSPSSSSIVNGSQNVNHT